jgi:serine protease Do
MKRILTLLLILVLIPTISLAGSGIMVEQSADTLSVNGTLSSQMMLKHNNANYVPLRFVSEALGAAVGYDKGNVSIDTRDTSKVDIERLKESCVMVVVSKNGKEVGNGSGTLIGYRSVLTAQHVINKGDSFRIVYNDGTSTGCELISSDIGTDSAILRPQRNDISPAKIGDSDEVKIGDRIFIIGSPMQNRNVVSEGKVTSVIGTLIDTSEKINPGNSGGGCFNELGELIGLANMTNQTGDTSYLFKINDVRKAMDE